MGFQSTRKGTALLLEPASDGTSARSALLAELGFGAVHSESVDEAVHLLRTNPMIDIALLDLEMAGSGVILTVAGDRDVPVLLQADRNFPVDNLIGVESGVYGFWCRASGHAALAAAISVAEALHRSQRDLRTKNAELKEYESRLSSVMSAVPIGIGTIKDRIILEINDWASRILGYEQEELIGHSSRILFMDDAEYERVGQDIYEQLRERGIGEMETIYRKKSGEPVDVLIRGTAFDADDPGRGITFAAWDISSNKLLARRLETSLSELRDSEARLTVALEEKEALYRELKHRVKNSMALMASLIGLEASHSENAAVQDVLENTRTRIESLASLYDLLGRSENPNSVRLDQYLGRILNTLSGSFVGDCDAISFRTDLPPLEVNARIAAPLGLVAMELVVNALKHAFPPGWLKGECRECVISVSIEETEEELVLEVADDGAGLPSDFDPEKTSGLGMELIRLLVIQMRGSWRFLDGPGVRIQVSVPARGAA